MKNSSSNEKDYFEVLFRFMVVMTIIGVALMLTLSFTSCKKKDDKPKVNTTTTTGGSTPTPTPTTVVTPTYGLGTMTFSFTETCISQTTTLKGSAYNNTVNIYQLHDNFVNNITYTTFVTSNTIGSEVYNLFNVPIIDTSLNANKKKYYYKAYHVMNLDDCKGDTIEKIGEIALKQDTKVLVNYQNN